jgi:hypothetical protein
MPQQSIPSLVSTVKGGQIFSPEICGNNWFEASLSRDRNPAWLDKFNVVFVTDELDRL